jgi:CheY-like chemotaxis protein
MSSHPVRTFPKFTILARDPETVSPKQRWLVVDDDPMIVELVTLILEEHMGAIVAGFTSGDEAWADIAAQPLTVDLVITDRDMPGCDGFELSRRIQAETPHIKVILITARHEDLDPEELGRSGILAVVPKPFSCEQLATLIGKLLPKDMDSTSPHERTRFSVAA